MSIGPTRFRRLQDLFEQIRHQPETEQRPQLAKIAESEPEVGAQLEDLLAMDRDSEHLPRDHAQVAAGDIPNRIGPYRIVTEIDAGGMGVVYEAIDDRSGQAVALKLIRRDSAMNAKMRQRFLREGRIAGSIDHPNCVFVVEASVYNDVPVIAMELVRGRTLEQVVAQDGPLPIDDCIDYALQLTDAVDHLHRRGIVHRDIKPSNCMVDEHGDLKLLDFGLSIEAVADAAVPRVKPHRFVGTPLYAAPEQLKATRSPAPASDIYSMAATIYSLIAGWPPFAAPTIEALAARVANEEPRSLDLTRTDVPVELNAILAKGLARNANSRWSTATAFRNALLDLPPAPVLAPMPRRVAAFCMDQFLVWQLPAAFGAFGDSTFSWLHYAAVVSYYLLLEGLVGQTIGQFLLALRVARNQRWSRRAARHAPSRTMASLPIYALFASWSAFPWAMLFSLPHIWWWCAWQTGTGLNDFLSRTRVTVRAPRNTGHALTPIAEAPRMTATSTTKPSDAPPNSSSNGNGNGKSFDNIRIVRHLHDTLEGQLYLAIDRSIERRLWLLVRPACTAPLPRGRRTLNRSTRLRWVAGGLAREQRWDAFLPPAGTRMKGAPRSLKPHPHLSALLKDLRASLDPRDATRAPELDCNRIFVMGSRVEVLDDFLAPIKSGNTSRADSGHRLAELAAGASGLRRTRDGVRVQNVPAAVHEARSINALCGDGVLLERVEKAQASLEAARGPEAIPRRSRWHALRRALLSFLFCSIAALLIAGITATLQYAVFQGLARDSRQARIAIESIGSAHRELLALCDSFDERPTRLGVIERREYESLKWQMAQTQRELDTARANAREVEAEFQKAKQLVLLWSQAFVGDWLVTLEKETEAHADIEGESVDNMSFVVAILLASAFYLLLYGWPLAWCLLEGCYFRGPLAGWLAGDIMVGSNNLPAKRRNCIQRACLFWIPLWLPWTCAGVLPLFMGWIDSWDSWTTAATVLGLFVTLCYIVGSIIPRRHLHDRIAGTYQTIA